MSGFFSRMRCYLARMFPLPRHLLLSAAIYLSVATFGARLLERGMTLGSAHSVIGIASVFGLLLMLRLMDELKDYDLDVKLFPDRPLCTGMVLASDIQVSLAIVTLALLGMNALTGEAFWSACVLVAFAFLMFRHFFCRHMLRASLPLTLATHQPILLLLLLHCLTVLSDEYERHWYDWDWRIVAPYLLLLWMPFLGWEISRKIRSPRDETQYVTYSLLVGPRRAAWCALTVESIPFFAAIYVDYVMRPNRLYLLAMSLSLIVYASGCLRFLKDITSSAKPLKARAELYVFCVLLTQVVTFGFLPGR